MKIHLNNNSQQKWEKILHKNSFQGRKINRLAKAVSCLESEHLNYDSYNRIFSYDKYSM